MHFACEIRGLFCTVKGFVLRKSAVLRIDSVYDMMRVFGHADSMDHGGSSDG